ncbi:metalloproteinase inhibitor 2-like [Heterodontus francisci]|uniref:metalloproteinase inhibitor 2-like n=1 Tax=Heterodontus francisci TaxID=7792 RepID=UPI00355BF5D4
MSCNIFGFLATGLLLLTVQQQSDACSCGPSHPQQAYCQSDVVIKGKIVGSKLVARDNSSDPNAFHWIQYEVQQQKMYKGFEKVEEVQYVYTPRADLVCGLVLEADQMNEDYVLSGNVESDGKMYINICSFNKPWSQLTPAQRTNLDERYRAGCQCMIIPCLSLPCSLSADNQCLWTDGILNGKWEGAQSQRYACSMKPSGMCQWDTGKIPRSRSFLRSENQ